MARRNRDVEVFSLSFLDCICCGFGAIILLLVLSEFGQPVQLEQSQKQLEGQVAELTSQLELIRGETDELNRELKGRIDAMQKEKLRLARLRGDLTSVEGQYQASRKDASVTNTVETELVSAYQTLTAEMQRLLAEKARRPRDEAIGGIPIDSEYVIFIIDTSASMTRNHWDVAQDAMREILDIYPKVKGIQVMNDQGRFMFEETKGKWLEDSPMRRAQIRGRMKAWNAFSASSPVLGIETAIRTYASPERRISLYVLGDEFTGESIQEALTAINELNKPDAKGRRPARIHAIGFPDGPGMPPFTSIRFAALMRYVCEQNNGTFVALNR